LNIRSTLKAPLDLFILRVYLLIRLVFKLVDVNLQGSFSLSSIWLKLSDFLRFKIHRHFLLLSVYIARFGKNNFWLFIFVAILDLIGIGMDTRSGAGKS